MNRHETQFEYEGFPSPTGTIVPDAVFDILMPELKDGELRVLLYIIRRTFGFMKQSDTISLRQMVEGIHTRDGRVLDRGTGLQKSAVATALKGLRDKKIIKVIHNRSATRGHEPTTYQLRFLGEAVEETKGENEKTLFTRPLSAQTDKGVSADTDKGLSAQTDIQETVLQQTEINLSNIRMHKNAELNVDNSGSHVDKPSRNRSSSPTSGEESRPDTKHTSSVALKDAASPSRDERISSEPESIGAVLKRGRGRPPKQAYSEDRQQITAYIQDFAREMGDQAPLKSSVTRADNLYQASGRPIALFVDAMYQARAKTKERTATIRGKPTAAEPFAPKAKMAYFFALLEDELGMREGGQLTLDA